MKKLLILAASVILFIELLDTTLLNACFVSIADNFDVDASRMSLPIISYIIGTCLFIPTVSWLSNRFNKIDVIITSLIVFSISSLLCAGASNIIIFSIFRLIQGSAISVSGATILITLLSVIKNTEIVKTMGMINIPALAGTALGPVLGAIFSYYLSWRLAFLMNVPVGICIALLLSPLRSLDLFKAQSSPKHFDFLGFTLITIFLIFSSIGFEKLTDNQEVIYINFIAIGILSLLSYLFLWKKRANQSSILNLSVFTNTNFKIGATINVLARIAMCGLPLLMSMVLQLNSGYSVIKAGLYLAIIAVSGIFAKLFSGSLSNLGVENAIVITSILTAFSILLIAPINLWMHHHRLWIPCVLLGFNMSLLYTAMNSILFLTLNKAEIPNATNIASIIQQFCIGLGILVAIGGFQFLVSANDVITNDAFRIICYCLSQIMLLNAALAFYYLVKPNLKFQKAVS